MTTQQLNQSKVPTIVFDRNWKVKRQGIVSGKAKKSE